jgi:hypothetical protein
MAGHREDGTSAEDRAHHPNRKVGASEFRGMSKDTLSGYRAQGYTHPTGPTTMLNPAGAANARSSYRTLRGHGESPQNARSSAIRGAITQGGMVEGGKQGWNNQ